MIFYRIIEKESGNVCDKGGYKTRFECLSDWLCINEDVINKILGKYEGNIKRECSLDFMVAGILGLYEKDVLSELNKKGLAIMSYCEV